MVSTKRSDLDPWMVRTAEFVQSTVHVKDCPSQEMPEYAFIGRSNVGKSSLINMLAGKKTLARISSTPGKTQTINHYIINKDWFLVDLPGYGFAKTAQTNRAAWEKMIRNYLQNREQLICVFLLIDSRVKPQANDLAFMEWLANMQIPFLILFTKTDKLKLRELQKSVELYQQTLGQTWTELPEFIITSAEKKVGKQEVLEYIFEQNQEFKKA